ncbi:ABC transporter permease [Gracilibacillus alcaliphilus]|uniref:ABC transporter permease n=1 Tax=Gracilibacillus alcaliphilus TaxID=1401441 RepID=UPI00195D52B9|nr:ABC transporter permease subunit [Gracilibacillus alcaliphilus]MBM7677749.1 putative aldouronate transport system permease protein [Gracilibacillus alcaliphilus]
MSSSNARFNHDPHWQLEKKKTNFQTARESFWKSRQLYLLLLPALIYLIVFQYIPMYGAFLAFKDFDPSLGILGSPWAGMKYFEMFFGGPNFGSLLSNTLLLSMYSLLIGFPIPIIFALFLNQLRPGVKRFVQTVTYAPFFISMVVLVSMLGIFLQPETGFINNIIVALGGDQINFMASAEWFRTVFITSGIWQTMGFNAIIYLAALSSVSPELHESAIVDGASKLRRIWHIDLPSILPTIIILLILAVGNLATVDWQKALLMQQGMNLSTSELIQTYVYKAGVINSNFSFGTAVGLFNSVINFVLLIAVNFIARKTSGNSLW